MGRVPASIAGTVIIIAAFAVAGAFGSAPRESPHPFDSLTAAEQEAAIEIVLASPRVSSLLGSHYQVIGASLNTDKARMMQQPGSRHADVWLYDYVSDQAFWARVELGGGTLIHMAPLPGVQPPLTAAELERAQGLVASRIDDGLGDVRGWIARLWAGASESACATNRCVLLAEPSTSWNGDSWAWLVNLSRLEVGGPHSIAGVEMRDAP